VIQVEDLSLTVLARSVAQQANVAPMDSPCYIPQHRSTPIGREELVAALVRHKENLSACAQELGISRVTLYRKLQRFSVMLDRPLMELPPHGRLRKTSLPTEAQMAST